MLLGVGGAAAAPAAPVTVGTKGNEPVVAISPDGTLYISALQHLYRSTNGGASWQELPGPIYTQQINLNSDSSLSVDPGNRLYMTFDYPYAGSTAVCTSDDHGDTWTCNPAVVPGGTDRMWVLAPSTTSAYETTNEGLYQTAFLVSKDRGLTWVPTQFGNQQLEPQTGPLLHKPCSPSIVQPIKVFGPPEQLALYVYTPAANGTTLLNDIRPTPLPLPNALPSMAFTRDGTLYAVSEAPNPAGGREIVVARSADEGRHWTTLSPIPQTLTGSATFAWLAAGAPGHVGIVFYGTPASVDPTTAPADTTWSAGWAETYDATDPSPTWTVTLLDRDVHQGPICAAADCMGTARFSGDFVGADFDAADTAHVSWMRQPDLTQAATQVRYARVPAAFPSTYVAPPCSSTAASVAVSGRVTARRRTGLPGVRLTLTGSDTARRGTTRRDGSFSFSGLRPVATYVLTPRRPGYRFTPPSRTISLLGASAALRFRAARVR